MNWTLGANSLLTIAVLSGCAATQPPAGATEPEVVVKTRTIDTACVTFKPLYPSKANILDDDFAGQVLAHNKAGALRCGWKPPSK